MGPPFCDKVGRIMEQAGRFGLRKTQGLDKVVNEDAEVRLLGTSGESAPFFDELFDGHPLSPPEPPHLGERSRKRKGPPDAHPSPATARKLC